MRDQVQNSFDEMQVNEEYFQKSIERTIKLLKRIQIEQKLDELLKRNEDISESLNEINEKTEQSNPGDSQTNDELTERQKEITDKLNRFEELKYKEIAKQLNISIKTVETQMSRALKKIKNFLREYLE